MLRALRAEVNGLLSRTNVKRKPALRRSDAPGALLATDLPFAAEPMAVENFCKLAEEIGWSIRKADNGWLLLDKEAPTPDVRIPADAAGECGCCLSLLRRHGGDADAREVIRRVLRASEAGMREFERLCGQLHAEMAAMLRLHQPLPGALTPHLAHAYLTLTDGRKQE